MLLIGTVTVSWYLADVVVLGVCMATKRNLLGVLMGVELVLNAPTCSLHLEVKYFAPRAHWG